MPDLSKLAEPFPEEDIEWRVSHAGQGANGIFCLVVAYITARAIMKRLDEVVGPENWRNETPHMIEVNGKATAFVTGISIRVDRQRETSGSGEKLVVHDNEWVTKWDVSEPTAVEPAKGGFSGAMKRAGAQWGIGRYLYRLDATFAEVSEKNMSSSRNWNKAKLPKRDVEYWWKAPGLPAWALPKFIKPQEGASVPPDDEDKGITTEELEQLKRAWRLKFAPSQKNKKELRDGFAQFVTQVVGEFPLADASCWTHDALEKCTKRINETKEPNGVSSDVPFE